MIRIDFQSGTLTLSGGEKLPESIAHLAPFDERSSRFRARGCDYAAIILALLREKIPFTDNARNYQFQDSLALKTPITPRPHQSKALASWIAADSRAVVSLPTGSGKTILALMAIAHLKRPTLILVPTIDLLTQWAATVEKFFGINCGMLGGGSKDIQPVTVSTYDSAVLNMEFIGGNFAFLIADECHHLPSPAYRVAAAMAIAPFRLGLTATAELDQEYSAVLADMMGNICCNIGIKELSGNILSAYEVRQLRVELSGREAADYHYHRSIYTFAVSLSKRPWLGPS